MSDTTNTPQPGRPDEPASPEVPHDATVSPAEPLGETETDAPRDSDFAASPAEPIVYTASPDSPVVVDTPATDSAAPAYSEPAADDAPASPAPLIEPEGPREEPADYTAPVVEPIDYSAAGVTDTDAPATGTAASDTTAATAAYPTAGTDAYPAAPPAEATAASPTEVYAAPPAATATDQPVRTVYVEAPQPPRAKGNRGLAILIAFVATIVFALLYLGGVWVATTVALAPTEGAMEFGIVDFVTNPVFYIPIIFFFVATILWGLIVNRAGWWAWVLGSILVAAAVYFGSYLTLSLLLRSQLGVDGLEGLGDLFMVVIGVPLIIAAIVAREVSMWFGLILASRGRKLATRNAQAREDFDREQAALRAERERVGY